MAMGNMADDLTKRWENFSLSEEESLEVEIHNDALEDIVTKGKSCLVGKLIAERIVGKDTIRSTLVRGWKPEGAVSFKTLGNNLFLVEFERFWDKARVLEGRPWIFEDNLFAMEDFNGLIPPSQMDFEKVAFWVRMYNLPLGCMGKDMGFQIGSSVGEVEEVETAEDGVGWGEFLRVRIKLDVTKPLSRGRILKLQGKSLWTAFQYEKIPKFCFNCGVIKHGTEGCANGRVRRFSGEATAQQYGSWLRVQERRYGAGRLRNGGDSAANSSSFTGGGTENSHRRERVGRRFDDYSGEGNSSDNPATPMAINAGGVISESGFSGAHPGISKAPIGSGSRAFNGGLPAEGKTAGSSRCQPLEGVTQMEKVKTGGVNHGSSTLDMEDRLDTVVMEEVERGTAGMKAESAQNQPLREMAFMGILKENSNSSSSQILAFKAIPAVTLLENPQGDLNGVEPGNKLGNKSPQLYDVPVEGLEGFSGNVREPIIMEKMDPAFSRETAALNSGGFSGIFKSVPLVHQPSQKVVFNARKSPKGTFGKKNSSEGLLSHVTQNANNLMQSDSKFGSENSDGNAGVSGKGWKKRARAQLLVPDNDKATPVVLGKRKAQEGGLDFDEDGSGKKGSRRTMQGEDDCHVLAAADAQPRQSL